MKTTVTLLTLFLVSNFLNAQTITLDLAKEQAEQDIPENTVIHSILLLNTLYSTKFKYEVKVRLVNEPIPAFPSRVFTSADDTTRVCEFLADKVKEAQDITQENLLPKFKEELLDSIKKADENKCKELIDAAKELLDPKTKIDLVQPITLSKCQKLTITVTRIENSNNAKKVWNYTFTTPCESPWKIHYGFTFSPNMMNPVSNYYAKSDTGSTFLVNKLNNQNKSFLENLTPTIMFTYSSPSAYSWKKGTANYSCVKAIFNNTTYRTGITGGIGINLQSPVVMVGPSLVFKENLMISAGLAIRQKWVLKGQYAEGQRLNETLDFDQLHEEKYMPEWYFSIAFRFDQNPFKNEEEENQEAEEE